MDSLLSLLSAGFCYLDSWPVIRKRLTADPFVTVQPELFAADLHCFFRLCIVLVSALQNNAAKRKHDRNTSKTKGLLAQLVEQRTLNP